jgi:hypothetical protein
VYCKLKEEGVDYNVWKNSCGRECGPVVRKCEKTVNGRRKYRMQN